MKLAMVAAGFSSGEADRLRRAMAAWKKRGGLEPFEARLSEGMRQRGYSEEFAARIYQQIRGFGEYGFPESHAASFALLVYVSAWLKRREPAAFTCALLNSQPMGFYSPSQLVQDARRHGVTVRPVDAGESDWECMVKGLGRAAADRLVKARGEGPFSDVGDLALRAGLSRRDLEALAEAGALRRLAGHRRLARWEVLGADPAPLPLLRGVGVSEAPPGLRAPTEGEDLSADYAALGLTLGRHPLALLRARLARRGILSAAELNALPHGRPGRTAGLVITRQRPGTATGVTFVTLEDETGTANVIVWLGIADRQRKELIGSRLLAVSGTVQREGEVVHLVARRL